MTDVISSNIAKIGKSGDHLEVWFKKGGKYLYAGAGMHFTPMLNAQSKGKYFIRNIKHKYKFKKIV